MGSSLHFQEDTKNLDILKQELPKYYSHRDKIAIKLHMGEKGNKYFLKPEYARDVVGVMKELGLKPFLFDSTVDYHGSRQTVHDHLDTAKEHGFTEEVIGCPVVVSEEFVEVQTDHLKAQVCRPLADADGMFVLTHVKGHPCSGFGASIKNLGMGGLTRQTKSDIHNGGSPELTGDCVACGICKTFCPGGAITIGKTMEFASDRCFGCSICIEKCPENALTPRVSSFDVLLSEGAQAVLKAVKKVYFMNVITQIAKYCDCWRGDNEIIAPDIGVLFGTDIVAIDKASLDLIVDRTGEDIFKKILQKSPIIHITASEELGLGTTNYTLEK
jgi:uncharacterized Fe-S center protein